MPRRVRRRVHRRLTLRRGGLKRNVYHRSRASFVKRVRGRGILDSLKSLASKAHSFVKDRALLSKGASVFGYNRVANALKAFGYGRKRRTVRRYATRRRVGRGFLSDVWSGVKNVGRAILPAVASVGTAMIQKKFGGRRRRTVRRVRRGGAVMLPNGQIWSHPRLPSVFGRIPYALGAVGGRRRTRRTRTRRGRGLVSSYLASLLPF